MTYSMTIDGEIVLVDEDDRALLEEHNWHVYRRRHRTSYVQRPGSPVVYLHREIMSAGPGEVVDHINGNGLDNRRANLRLCTPAENGANAKLSRRSTTGVKGVHYEEFTKKYRAEICRNRKKYRLGRYDTLNEAAEARRKAEIALFGEFSRRTADR